VVLVTTIPAQKPNPEWLFIHFCSLAKMIFVWISYLAITICKHIAKSLHLQWN